MKINPSIIRRFALVVIALTLFMLPSIKLPYLDQKADAYFSDAMTKAGLSYGVCRMVNASVSMIKESQIQLEPAGLGVSLAAGQVLDPLDDMTERASNILVNAIISLGIQKIAHELCVSFAPSLIAIFLIAHVITSLFNNKRAKTIRDIMLKLIVLVSVARLCLPTSSIISSYLNNSYFTPEITKTKDEIAMISPYMDSLNDIQMPEIDGVMGTVKNGFIFMGKKTTDLGMALKEMIQNMGKMVSNLLKLSYLYVALFVIQVILLPTGAFLLLSRITSAFCGTSIPYNISLKYSNMAEK